MENIITNTNKNEHTSTRAHEIKIRTRQQREKLARDNKANWKNEQEVDDGYRREKRSITKKNNVNKESIIVRTTGTHSEYAKRPYTMRNTLRTTASKIGTT